MLDQRTNQPEITEDEVDPFADTKPEIVPDQIINAAVQVEKGRPGLYAAHRSDVGAIRKRNEDSCLVFSSESGGHFPLLPFGDLMGGGGGTIRAMPYRHASQLYQARLHSQLDRFKGL